MKKTGLYKAVLIFNLTKDSAEEELDRSEEETSFSNRLAQQPGFVEYELVKISDEKTMSIQTWKSEQDCLAALEAVKKQREEEDDPSREVILLSRELLNGPIRTHRVSDQ